MRSVVFLVLVLGSVLGMASQPKAQFMIIELSKAYVSSEAAGIIVDATGSPIPGALVNRMNLGWKNVLDSTQADYKGRFRFTKKNSSLYYLEITNPGFQVMHVKMKVVRGTKKRPRIKVEIAT